VKVTNEMIFGAVLGGIVGLSITTGIIIGKTSKAQDSLNSLYDLNVLCLDKRAPSLPNEGASHE